jgi:hypothetical protein
LGVTTLKILLLVGIAISLLLLSYTRGRIIDRKHKE